MKKTHVMTGLAVALALALGLGVSSYALANEENMKVIASVEDALKNSKKDFIRLCEFVYCNTTR